jgi:hypothetical protein
MCAVLLLNTVQFVLAGKIKFSSFAAFPEHTFDNLYTSYAGRMQNEKAGIRTSLYGLLLLQTKIDVAKNFSMC